MTDVLAGFETTEFTHAGSTKQVFRAGTGPGILVMTEMPGITPRVVEFAQRLVDAGYTVALPDLFGTPGKEPGMGYVLGWISRACVSREFTTWALNRTSPVIDWLRALGRDLHARCGGPGVGAIGMCFFLPALFSVGNAGTLTVAIIGLTVFGLGWGFFDCNNMPILCQIARPEWRATGYGIMNLVSISCGGLADWGVGMMSDNKVPLYGICSVFASAAVSSVVLVLLIRPREIPS